MLHRLPEDQRWSFEDLTAIRATPWALIPGDEGGDEVPIVVDPRWSPAEDGPAMPTVAQKARPKKTCRPREDVAACFKGLRKVCRQIVKGGRVTRNEPIRQSLAGSQ